MATHLPMTKKTHVFSCLIDGVSQRATSRITGVNRDRVSSLALRAGRGCAVLHDRLFRDLSPAHVRA